MQLNKNLIVTALTVCSVLSMTGLSAFAAGPALVNLGAAGNFVILTKTGISTTGTTAVVGDLGISPAEASYITGFDLMLPAGGAYSTSAVVAGKIYAPSYANPTPEKMTTAVLAMQDAYTDAAGRTNPTAIELGAGNIGGMTLAPGLYKWSTGVTVPTDVTLSGGANDVWIFQVAQNLTVGSGAKVILAGGAQASNIFWVVAGQTTLGTTSVFNGTILDQTAIVLNTGAVLNGRALAQSAVTLDASAVTAPIYVAPAPYVAPVTVVTPTQTVSATPAMPATSAVPTVSPAMPATPAVSATPSSQGQSDQMKALLTTLHSLQDQVQAQRQSNTASASAPATNLGQQVRMIAMNLGRGIRHDNVTLLQQFLIAQNKGPAAAALAKVGASAYFGNMTRDALAEFQAKAGISPASGNFGPITRSYLKSH